MPGLIEQWSGYLTAALVVLLAYQQWRLYQLRKRTIQREELFRIVTENAADMIALVDVKGRRLYNSPAYEKVLGYTPEELEKTSSFEQIHPEDRYKILEASREARTTGVGKKLEYRIRHKNGEWRILESAASTIRDKHGEVEKLVIVNRDITDRKHTEKLLEHNSFHDGLTGLPNRRLLLDRLQRSYVRAQRNPDYQYAVLLVDIDNFKTLNDNFGPTAGDQVMMEFGGRLASSLRHHDTVARPGNQIPSNDAVLSRMGGDEFTILLEGITDPSDALRVAHRLQTAMAAPFTVAGHDLPASASIGIALSTDQQDRSEDLLQCADVAVHRAKALGGARCELFDEGMHTRAVNRLKLEAELRIAIDRRQFQLCYQPILNLETRQAAGFEALVRWHHPEQGVVSPSKFIEVAERAGLMVPIGKWVIREACRQLRAWQSAYPSLGSLTMTVNISAKQFVHADLRDDLKAAIQENHLTPSCLQIELTEADAQADPKLTSDLFAQLKHLGVRISIGDFGTGRSSLSWLRRSPLDELKIDRSLVANMPSDRSSYDVVNLTILLARELNVEVVAEGIETAVHLERIRRLGCEFGQGYFFSKPLEAGQADELLKQQSQRAKAAATGRK
ncbi:MAG TPA: EAL domain-containing protein [Terriglobales bacterium]|nr:EAL domain-containing protein [Terriglobales bacterium]